MTALLEMPKKSQYSPGEHPMSLKNLTHEGRPSLYGENKKRRELVVTDTGWQGLKELAKEKGFSVSELIERVGRGTIKLED